MGLIKISVVLSMLIALFGCGGGGSDSCPQSGTISIGFTPQSIDASTTASVLTYVPNQTNTWTLNIPGVPSGCLDGLSVVARDVGAPAVPTGFLLNSSTGTITKPASVNVVEGNCLIGASGLGGTIAGRSVNRICPTGQTLSDDRFILVVSSSRYNTNKIPTLVNFRP